MESRQGSFTDSTSTLEEYFVNKKLLDKEEIFQAQDYALTRDISVEEALLFLEMVDYNELGKYLATVFKVPYIPLLRKEPSETAKSLIPLKLADRFKIFPVKYDPKKRELVLAVVDPTQPQFIDELKSTLPNVAKLSLSVSSAAEIERAIEAFYKGKKLTSAPVLEVPEDFSILPDPEQAEQELTLDDKAGHQEKIVLLEANGARARALKTLLQTEGYDKVTLATSPPDASKVLEEKRPDLMIVDGQTFRPGGPWLSDIARKTEIPPISYYEITPFLLGQEYSYRQMSDALVNVIAFLVRKHFENDQDRLKETVPRVKHCKLTALRMGLSRSQVDGVVLAAWLSGGQVGELFVKQVSTPYRLEEILYPNTSDDDTNTSRVEATILDTVIRYQAFIKEHPKVSGDMNQIREALNDHTHHADHMAVTETLFRILKEEAFLDGVDRGLSARILVVDPKSVEDSPALLRLSNEGFEMKIVKTAKEAAHIISSAPVDLVISEVALDDTNGLKLCRAIKRKGGSEKIPFLFLTEDKGERLHADCLAAGADDFLLQPVDMEVLTLKVQRLISLRQANQPSGGVQGSLTEMNLSDLIQSLSAGDKDVEIHLESGGQQGKIFMQQGDIVHAETRNLQGDEAFYELVAWQHGNFNIVSCNSFPSRTIHSPLMSMLIEGARRLDEASDS